MHKEVNYYLCDHNDSIAEKVGSILEEMGLLEFSSLAKRHMNLKGNIEERKRDIISSYYKQLRQGGNINCVIFLTKDYGINDSTLKELTVLRQICRNRKINLYTVLDTETRKLVKARRDLFEWLLMHSELLMVEDIYYKIDVEDVAYTLAIELVRQRMSHMGGLCKSDWTRGCGQNSFIQKMARTYSTMPDANASGKFLLLFSVFEYINERINFKSTYKKCMDFLLNKSLHDLIFDHKELELASGCLKSELLCILDKKMAI